MLMASPTSLVFNHHRYNWGGGAARVSDGEDSSCVGWLRHGRGQREPGDKITASLTHAMKACNSKANNLASCMLMSCHLKPTLA